MIKKLGSVLSVLALAAMLPFGASAAETTLIPKGAAWKYLDDGSDQDPVTIRSVQDPFGFYTIFEAFGVYEAFEGMSVADFIEGNPFWGLTGILGGVVSPEALVKSIENQSVMQVLKMFRLDPVVDQLPDEAKGVLSMKLKDLMETAGIDDQMLFDALEESGVMDALEGIDVEDILIDSPAMDVLRTIKLGDVFAQFPDWRRDSFDDSGWKDGEAQFGFGEDDQKTEVDKQLTTYFRHIFNVTDPAAFASVKVRVLRDDGVVIYLNGVEVARSNMRSGAVANDVEAASEVHGDDENTFFEYRVPRELLKAGPNVLAAEVHLSAADSSDMSFDLELVGSDVPGLSRGPYLNSGSPTSVVVRWRTDAPTDSVVRFGADPLNLLDAVTNATAVTEHEVRVTGLGPERKYFYSIGSSVHELSSGADQYFYTAVPAGTVRPVRFWVLGDSGTADDSAAAVRDAYYNYAAGKKTDFMLMLGDNAYTRGTDAEYQKAVFDFYPSVLKNTMFWSCVGNHETDQAKEPDPNIPYYLNFTFPTNAEAGGIASGTENYYSFNYANVHFVCLDSMTSERTADGAMATWMKSDLDANTLDWVVVYFHHPPYTKGSHDSDNGNGQDPELVEMRENLLPIFEQYGVDLVLSGHSHVYERSFLLDGHYGDSTSFNNSMKKDGGSGRSLETGAYKKGGPEGTPHEGTVYVVAGSSGQDTPGAALNHPAMFYSVSRLGSLVLEVQGKRLDAKFLNNSGTVEDYFTLLKNTASNLPPAVAFLSPTNGQIYRAGGDVPISVAATDSDGTVNRVAFYLGDQLMGVDTEAPYELVLTNMVEGEYDLKAEAVDELEVKSEQATVHISVRPEIESAQYNGNKFEIYFTAKAGERYIVEMANDVESTTWTTLTEVEPQDRNTRVLVLYVVQENQKFFRLRKPAPPPPPAPPPTP